MSIQYKLCEFAHSQTSLTFTFRQQIMDLGLEDPVAERKGESLGFLRLYIRVSYDVEEDPVALAPQCSRKGSGKERGAHLWSKVLNVTLLEGKGLPAMDDNGQQVSLSCCVLLCQQE